MKLDNIVPAIGGKGGVGGLIESVLGGNKQQPNQPGQTSGQQQPGDSTQQQNQKPGSPLQNILDALGGKQKSKQQTPPPPAQEQPKSGEEDKLPDPSNPK
jgi:hypothetical protein